MNQQFNPTNYALQTPHNLTTHNTSFKANHRGQIFTNTFNACTSAYLKQAQYTLTPYRKPLMLSSKQTQHSILKTSIMPDLNSTTNTSIKDSKQTHLTTSNKSTDDSDQKLFGSINLDADLNSNALSQQISREEDREQIRLIMAQLNFTSNLHLTTSVEDYKKEKWRQREYERAIRNKQLLEMQYGRPTTREDLIREKRNFERMIMRDVRAEYSQHPERFTYFDIPDDGNGGWGKSATIGDLSDDDDEEVEAPQE